MKTFQADFLLKIHRKTVTSRPLRIYTVCTVCTVQYKKTQCYLGNSSLTSGGRYTSNEYRCTKTSQCIRLLEKLKQESAHLRSLRETQHSIKGTFISYKRPNVRQTHPNILCIIILSVITAAFLLSILPFISIPLEARKATIENSNELIWRSLGYKDELYMSYKGQWNQRYSIKKTEPEKGAVMKTHSMFTCS